MEGCSAETDLEKIKQEIDFMKECRHKYVVELCESFIVDDVLWVSLHKFGTFYDTLWEIL